MTWIPIYLTAGVLTAAAVFLLGSRAAVDTGIATRAAMAALAGLCWPAVVIGVVQLAVIHLLAAVVNLVDRPRGVPVAPVLRRGDGLAVVGPRGGIRVWPRRAAGM